MSDLQTYLKKGAVVVDVRNPDEFRGGANPKSINIPLPEIEGRVNELDPKKPVVVCCASGARSEKAKSFLKEKGFDVINAGSWKNLD